MAVETSSAPPTARVQDVVQTFRPTKLFRNSAGSQYTSLDFDDSGEFLLCSRTDDTIQLFNTRAGAHAKELKSHKYGSALARFTHHSTSIIYASTKVDNDIRYLSMHDNNFLRYFKGHTDRVTSLTLSPSNDTFLSGSLDNTVKLWDCRSSNRQGQLNLLSPWFTAIDPGANVIAIASPPAQMVALYDLRQYEKPPFATFDYQPYEERFRSRGQRPGEGWTGLEFSNNGRSLLLTTNGPGHFVLDAFSGDLKYYLHRTGGADRAHTAPGEDLPKAESNSTPSYIQGSAGFSPDGRYVVGGNGSQHGLLVWDCEAPEPADMVLEPMTDLPSQRPAKVVAYNPRHNLVASADRDVMMWLPDPDMA